MSSLGEGELGHGVEDSYMYFDGRDCRPSLQPIFHPGSV
jgi:hypothetical protein